MSNKILSQGCYDSACFPYAIMNGFKTLVKPESDNFDFLESLPIWKDIIKMYPQPNTLISGDYFFDHFLQSDMSDKDDFIDNQFHHIMKSSIEIINSRGYGLKYRTINIQDIEDINFSKEVLIVLIEKPVSCRSGNTIQHHYICINGRSSDYYNVMCSFTIHSVHHSTYKEELDAETRRCFNNQIKVDLVNENSIGAGKNITYLMYID